MTVVEQRFYEAVPAFLKDIAEQLERLNGFLEKNICAKRIQA